MHRKNRKKFYEVWQGVDGTNADRPNRHVPEHHCEVLADFAAVINASAARFETKHSILRAAAANSNYKNLEVTMIESENIYEAVFYLAQGGASHCLADGVSNWCATDPAFQWAINRWAGKATTYAGTGEQAVGILAPRVTVNAVIKQSQRPAIDFVAANNFSNSDLKNSEADLCYPVVEEQGVQVIIEHVSEIQLNQRETYRRHIKVGCWYTMSELTSQQSNIVRVQDCFYFEFGKDKYYWVTVQTYAKGNEVHGNYYDVIEKFGDPMTILVDLIQRPVHVVHNCRDQCQQSENRRVSHNTSNHTYIHNSLYMK
jgi:hypothetical protein